MFFLGGRDPSSRLVHVGSARRIPSSASPGPHAGGSLPRFSSGQGVASSELRVEAVVIDTALGLYPHATRPWVSICMRRFAGGWHAALRGS
jgi:hypothetical protein